MGVEPAGPETLLRAEGLRQVYDGRVVVEVEAIEVRAGEVLALLGPNGAGKSTLMRLLAGLEKPERGRLYYKGRAVEPGDRELRAAAVAVLQRPYLWRGTVRYNVEYGLRVRGIPAAERRSRAGAALDTLGARELEDVPVNALSGGEAQRVALARALAPKIRVVAVSPGDMAAHGLAPGDRVRVATRRGDITLKVRSDRGVPEGMLSIPFCFAEAPANVLTNPQLDPVGMIPEFKFCAARIERIAERAAAE